METTGLRIYGKGDLRLETFELPKLKDDEVLVKIVTDSLCMSSYKASVRGSDHKRVPDDIAEAPTVLGHEFCGEIVEVGARRKKDFKQGQRFVVQTGMKETYDAIGYSFRYMGGDMTYGIIPAFVLDRGYVLPYEGEAFFHGSLAEPLSCVIGAAHANYHTIHGEYEHIMEVVKGGKAAALAALGPMGLALLDYLIHREHSPALLVATDIDEARLERAAGILTVKDAKANGVELVYHNTGKDKDPVAALMELTGGTGYDDVFVFAPVAQVVEQGDAILGYDGCMNFFAGPSDEAFSAGFNFYNVHYNATHITGTSGGNTDDMVEALDMATRGNTNPAILVTHIGGLDSAKDATLNLPSIAGGKKVIYNHISLPLTAISDFGEKGKDSPLFAKLAKICDKHGGLWSAEAERYLLANAEPLDAAKYRQGS
ncbi:MAG: zinc-binding dehydrogenase [Clostridiales Family XIII bacterium]|jgi:threonine dehydrogenase-like Zn-dependent dehydrogenase|nr:zinc-binding dehydrogenase [Clostridiales Family XIII bacterium]